MIATIPATTASSVVASTNTRRVHPAGRTPTRAAPRRDLACHLPHPAIGRSAPRPLP